MFVESDVSHVTATITNISQSLPHITAGKELAHICYEEITSLSPYMYRRIRLLRLLAKNI